MNVLEHLASSLGRRDEGPNQELAKRIAAAGDKKAVKELVDHLHNAGKDIQSDCIKVLYEIGATHPGLISPYAKELVALLDHKNNRLQWGAMTALHAIAAEAPALIVKALPKIIAVADKGSVITNDHCVGILVKLCAMEAYADDAFLLLNERLLKSPVNQLPMYAEQALPAVATRHKKAFVRTLSLRLEDIEKEPKRKRVEKVLKKLQEK